MKIFSNFDTKLDVKAFKKKIKEYGDGNVILVKRHPLFLYKAFLYALFALAAFIVLISILYVRFWENLIYFYVFLFLHLIGISIWLFILFRKILKNLKKYKEFVQYKKDIKNIDLGQFWSFLKQSIVLILYQFIVSFIDIIAIYFTRTGGLSNFSWWVSLIFMNSLFLFLIIRILYRFIDFEMDFVLITKDEIEAFNQTGIFRRKVVSIDLKKCRSITTEKKWFFRSMFNIGSLLILSEWDKDKNGEIRFNYIHRLWALKKAILWLIYKNKKGWWNI